jgi:hypothetical protein
MKILGWTIAYPIRGSSLFLFPRVFSCTIYVPRWFQTIFLGTISIFFIYKNTNNLVYLKKLYEEKKWAKEWSNGQSQLKKLRVSLHENVNSKSWTKLKKQDFLVISHIHTKGLHKDAIPGFPFQIKVVSLIKQITVSFFIYLFYLSFLF